MKVRLKREFAMASQPRQPAKHRPIEHRRQTCCAPTQASCLMTPACTPRQATQSAPFTKLYLKKYTMTVLPLPFVLEVRFHATDQGREPVRDWLKSLSPPDPQKYRRRHQDRSVRLAIGYAAGAKSAAWFVVSAKHNRRGDCPRVVHDSGPGHGALAWLHQKVRQDTRH